MQKIKLQQTEINSRRHTFSETNYKKNLRIYHRLRENIHKLSASFRLDKTQRISKTINSNENGKKKFH